MQTRSLVALLLFAGSPALLAAGCKMEEERAAPPAQEAARPAAPAPTPPVKETPSPAAALTPDEQATIEKVMDARDEMARIAELRAGDCDKAAKEIEAVVERNRALLAATSALESDADKRGWIGEKYGARMLASSSKLMALIEHCDQHEGLTRIFESLD